MPKKNELNCSNYDELKTLIIASYPITSIDFYRKYKCSKATVKRISGGLLWNQILIDCGLAPNAFTKSIYSKDDIVFDIISVKNKFSYISAELYRKNGKYSQTIIDSVFGSFGNALESCGFKSKMKAKTMTNQDMVDHGILLLSRLGAINGRLITKYSDFSSTTVLARFGSLENYYSLIGYNGNNHNTSPSAVYVFNKIAEILNEQPVFEVSFNNCIGVGGKPLRYDAYYKTHNLLVEFNGHQHYIYSKKYHNNLIDFSNHVLNDQLKSEFAIRNGFIFLSIPYDITTDDAIRHMLSAKLNVTF